MSKYNYLLINSDGKEKKGSLEGTDERDIASQIKRDGWHIISIIQDAPSSSFASLFQRKYKLSAVERIEFTDHLASMIHTGTPLVEALNIYHDEEEDKKAISYIVEDIVGHIKQGHKLSESLSNFPETFSSFYVALVRAGETTGNLDETLSYLAGELRREYEFYARIKSALLYPCIVLSLAFAVMMMLIFLVIPKITELTKSLGGDLPLSTKIVSSIATFLTSFGPVIAIFFAIAIFSLIYSLKNKAVREKIDPYILRVPVFGRLIKRYILTRFLRIVGSSLKYGIPISTSFMMAGDVVNNKVYRDSCKSIEINLNRGMNLSTSLSVEGAYLFPKSIVRTVRGAEKTGTVDIALLRLSNFYETEVDRSLKRLTDLIEPMLVIGLGLIVGAIAISVITPIYQLTSKIR